MLWSFDMSFAAKRLPRRPAPTQHFQPRRPGIAYDMLDELVGYAVRRAQIAIYENFAETVGPEITPQRFSALTVIDANPDLRQSDLAAVLGIARSGVVMLVDELERMGLVERASVAEDRRAYALRLTEQGKKRLESLRKTIRAHDDLISGQLSASEKRHLFRLLAKLGNPGKD
jgi:DNA-binding MarR family transcriptional regulator